MKGQFDPAFICMNSLIRYEKFEHKDIATVSSQLLFTSENSGFIMLQTRFVPYVFRDFVKSLYILALPSAMVSLLCMLYMRNVTDLALLGMGGFVVFVSVALKQYTLLHNIRLLDYTRNLSNLSRPHLRVYCGFLSWLTCASTLVCLKEVLPLNIMNNPFYEGNIYVECLTEGVYTAFLAISIRFVFLISQFKKEDLVLESSIVYNFFFLFLFPVYVISFLSVCSVPAHTTSLAVFGFLKTLQSTGKVVADNYGKEMPWHLP